MRLQHLHDLWWFMSITLNPSLCFLAPSALGINDASVDAVAALPPFRASKICCPPIFLISLLLIASNALHRECRPLRFLARFFCCAFQPRCFVLCEFASLSHCLHCGHVVRSVLLTASDSRRPIVLRCFTRLEVMQLARRVFESALQSFAAAHPIVALIAWLGWVPPRAAVWVVVASLLESAARVPHWVRRTLIADIVFLGLIVVALIVVGAVRVLGAVILVFFRGVAIVVARVT